MDSLPRIASPRTYFNHAKRVRHAIVYRADNGGPMRGAILLATLDQLGVIASFSRPGVSADNAFSETVKRMAPWSQCPQLRKPI